MSSPYSTMETREASPPSRRLDIDPAHLQHVQSALDEIRAGKIVILVDDEDRENEGDLCMAADRVTPEAINFMAKHGRGLICLTLTEEQVEQLELPMMTLPESRGSAARDGFHRQHRGALRRHHRHQRRRSSAHHARGVPSAGAPR